MNLRRWMALGCVLFLSSCTEKDPSKKLEEKAKEFVELLSEKKMAQAVTFFDSTMKLLITPEKLNQVWSDMLSKKGAFIKQLGVRTVSKDGYQIVFVGCELQGSGMDVQVVFGSKGQISGLFFRPLNFQLPTGDDTPWQPPPYANPASFVEQEVEIGTGEWKLPGTLAIPNGQGSFPALVLVHGSGPNDRDESIGPNKPFRDLAWGLATKGIAVLRYEKRTKHFKEKLDLEHFTIQDEVIDDALNAVQLLRKTERIDSKKIFVLGHSLGGEWGPRIVATDSNIAGLIVMAGPTRPFGKILLDQMTYISMLDGTLSETEKSDLDRVKKQVETLNTMKPSDTVQAKDLPFGIPKNYWLGYRDHDPAEEAKKLSQPMLILQGQRDYQVTAEEDFIGWKNALSGRTHVTFKLYPKLNHLMMAGEGSGKSAPSEYEVRAHVDPEVIGDIANWVQTQGNSPGIP
jgi:uncharacterized protein